MKSKSIYFILNRRTLGQHCVNNLPEDPHFTTGGTAYFAQFGATFIQDIILTPSST